MNELNSGGDLSLNQWIWKTMPQHSFHLPSCQIKSGSLLDELKSFIIFCEYPLA